jgi:hypothetical protein
MKRRLLLVPVAVAAVVLSVPISCDVVLGHLGGEPFQDERPLRYWLRTLGAGDGPARERAAYVLGQLVSPGCSVPARAKEAAMAEQAGNLHGKVQGSRSWPGDKPLARSRADRPRTEKSGDNPPPPLAVFPWDSRIPTKNGHPISLHGKRR